jgi:hypothetical protein
MRTARTQFIPILMVGWALSLAASSADDDSLRAICLWNTGASDLMEVERLNVDGLAIRHPRTGKRNTVQIHRVTEIRFLPDAAWREGQAALVNGQADIAVERMRRLPSMLIPTLGIPLSNASQFAFTYIEMLRALDRPAEALRWLDTFPSEPPTIIRIRAAAARAAALADLGNAAAAQTAMDDVQTLVGSVSREIQVEWDLRVRIVRARLALMQGEPVIALRELAPAALRPPGEATAEILHLTAFAHRALAAEPTRVNNPLLQEALRRIVPATADGAITSANNAADSAFDQLQGLYPNSPWTLRLADPRLTLSTSPTARP